MYNTTNLTNANTVYEITREINTLSGQLLGIMILVTLFLVLLTTFRKYQGDFKSNLLTASAITTVVAIALWSIGFVAMHVIIYCFVALFASLLMYLFGG